jgi:cytochrome c
MSEEKVTGFGWQRVAAMAVGALCLVVSHAADAAGDKTRGRELYEKHCLVCHTLEPEFHKEGPSLYRIWGKRAGTVPFFGKYKALKGSDIVWNEKTLDEWLADPRRLVGGKDSGMTFRLEDARDRQDVIAFMKTLR